MQAGKLRHRIAILTPGPATRDTFGGASPTWTVLARDWVAIEPISGREADVARGKCPTVSHKLTMRYRSNLSSRCQIMKQDRTFQVNYFLDPEERKRELWIFCTEITS